MEQINYLNESLIHGQIGKLLTMMAFVLSILASFSFFKSDQKDDAWDHLGALSLKIFVILEIGIVVLLFSMLVGHYFEYQYVYNHSASSLPFYYQFSSFWEGQEGSFLLWTFWQSLIAGVLLYTCQTNRKYVLGTYSLILVFLSSMVLGLQIGTFKLGNNPFLLFREAMPQMPLFARADYLKFIEDGTGLNPLLQNYWMVIHPPTLFLGYSLMSVPFVYTIGFLFAGNEKQWIKSAHNWALLGGGILGLGVLMGGAWAYEALSFGGFWAWDPVENASILPWIIIVAGIHTMLAYKHRGYSKFLTVLFYLGGFLMVLYASFLTRSGILGDTSVHSFTGDGMMGQLIAFQLVFLLISVFGIWKYRKSLKEDKKEEKVSSREFWLFFGSVVLLVSWIQIIFFTSIPVLNKILAPIESALKSLGLEISLTQTAIDDVVGFYNMWQLPFGIAITLMSAFAFYLKYKETKWVEILKRTLSSIIFGIVLALFLGWHYGFSLGLLLLAIVSSISIFTNLVYIIEGLKWRLKNAGGALTHLGFALLMLGVVLSSGMQEAVSINEANIKYGEGYDAVENRENILLYKGVASKMGDYYITYVGDSVVGVDRFFKIYYEQVNAEDEIIDQFYLYPYIQENPKMGTAANPDTRHYLAYDLFTHVTSVSSMDLDEKVRFEEHKVFIGDTIWLSKLAVSVNGINKEPINDSIQEGDLAIGLNLTVMNLEEKHNAEPIFMIRDGKVKNIVEARKDLGASFKFDYINPNTEEVTLSVKEYQPMREFVIMKAIKFPWINIVWVGTILLFAGFMVAFRKRLITK